MDLIEQASSVGKRDFGSFHSSNVEELIGCDESNYKKPHLVVSFDAKLDFNVVDFGSEQLRENLFYLSNEFTFLNHGAFGMTFRPVVDYVHKWQQYAESQPLRFYDRQIMPLVCDLTRTFARQVFKCKPNELTLVENCTFAFNSVINSMKLNRNEKVFIYSTTYGVYKKILREKCTKSDAILIEHTVNFPIFTQEDLDRNFLQSLAYNLANDANEKRIKYVFVDHIPSNHPFIVPINKIADMLKQMRADIVLVVDAAHSLGSVKLFDLKNIDILFTNCHKWFCGPKGTALLFKNEHLQTKKSFELRPAVMSHGITAGFNSEFIWSGLKDYSAYMGLYGNLEIWLNHFKGFDCVVDYCHELIKKAGEWLCAAWSTEFLVNPEFCSTMLCVRLPDMFVKNTCKLEENQSPTKLTYDQAEIVQNFLFISYKIEVPIKCIQEKLYVRISAHIYNKLTDYIHLGNAVLDHNK
jgi:isopenicillin-N epimerase